MAEDEKRAIELGDEALNQVAGGSIEKPYEDCWEYQKGSCDHIFIGSACNHCPLSKN